MKNKICKTLNLLVKKTSGTNGTNGTKKRGPKRDKRDKCIYTCPVVPVPDFKKIEFKKNQKGVPWHGCETDKKGRMF